MINKIKTYMNSRSYHRIISMANDESVVKPFLHGSQLQTIVFGDYIFMQHSPDNIDALKKRNFSDFRATVEKHVNWELKDDIFDLSEAILYNKTYNLMITLIPQKIWNTFNTAINIAKRTPIGIETQKEIFINAFNELNQ